MDIDDIARNAETALDSALFEDYFTINDSRIDIEADLNPFVIADFCIAAPGVLKFELVFNLDDNVSQNLAL